MSSKIDPHLRLILTHPMDFSWGGSVFCYSYFLHFVLTHLSVSNNLISIVLQRRLINNDCPIHDIHMNISA